MDAHKIETTLFTTQKYYIYFSLIQAITKQSFLYILKLSFKITEFTGIIRKMFRSSFSNYRNF